MYNLDEDFKKYFPKLPFTLKNFQKRVITNIKDNGNTLCIMQTGGGKSLIYWMSGLAMEGITIVVSPLTSLIVEQANKIREQGYEALAIPGGMSAAKQMNALKNFANGKINPKFIFLSPEKIATDGFLEHCLKARKEDIRLLVVDEVHCVSQWGISFRPFYKRIPDLMSNIFGEDNWIRVLGLTATLNPKELSDICSSFRIKQQNVIKQDLLMRSEIQLHVQKFTDEAEKTEKFWDIVNIHSDEKILVYVYRKYNKHGVEDLCNAATERGYNAVSFHGDMTAEERADIIEQFKENKVNLVFATNAFGMGIDIPDIRVVIHFMIPESLEQYYQEVGRAARDGHGANAYLLYTNKNIEVKRRYFIDGSFPDEDKLREVYAKIAHNTGFQTLAYFDDEEIQQCLPYYLEAGIIKLECKGFADLKSLKNVSDPTLQSYIDSTKTKNFITTVKKNSIAPATLASKVYQDIIVGKADTAKALERWLILNIASTEIDDNVMQLMLTMIEEKKKYKHELLDYLVYVIDNNSSSQYLHQEIASYLGTEKHNLNKIYETEDGNHVRSKSEVIICNLLYKSKIQYAYEEKLPYGEGKWMEPDFTITAPNGKVFYWEHIGMLGKEEYDARWIEKLAIYRERFPGQLLKTYESGNLSQDAMDIINDQILT